MHGQMREQKKEWTKERMNGCIYWKYVTLMVYIPCMDGWMDGWMDVCVYEWMVGWMYGWMDS